MAVKDKDTTKEPAVTRISAKDGAKPVKTEPSTSPKGQIGPVSKERSGLKPLIFLGGLLSGIGGYFKGAWQELRLVRWPNRKATWGLTGALLAFTAFFVLFILLIDALFEYLFKLVIG